MFNRYVKKVRVFCFVSFMLGISVIDISADVVDRIVAVVNNDIILLSELNAMTVPFEKKIKSQKLSPRKEKEMLFKMRTEVLNQLINKTIADQEIKKYGIRVSEKEIDNTIERIKEANFLTDEKLRQELKKDGVTYESYRENIKDQILRQKLVNYQVESKIIITREDIKKYYLAHKKDFSSEKKWHLRNILIPVPPYSSKEDKKKIYDRMKTIHGKIKEGESFSMMAQRYSESPSAKNGGDIGKISDSSLSAQIKKALKGLKEKEVTPILDTDFGYQIFYIEEIVGEEGKGLEAATPEIREKLYGQIVNKKYKKWLEDLRKKSHIKIIK